MAYGRCGVGGSGGGTAVGEVTLSDKSGNAKYLRCDGSEVSSGAAGYDTLIGILQGISGDWQQSTYTTGDYSRLLAYGDGKYVAIVGQSTYKVAISTDGATWTLHGVAGITYPPYALTYGGGLWVLVCGYKEILTSPDGINWTKVVSRPSSGYYTLVDVTYGGGTFVAIGNSVVDHLGAAPALYSKDGVTWTEKTTSTSGGLNGVTYGGGQFVITGASGYIATSPDGVTWTKRTAPSSQTLYKVAYGNGVFVTCDGAYYPVTSPDGITWTKHGKAPSANTTMSPLVYGNGLFHTFYSDSNANRCVAVSEDGAAWELELTLPNAQAPAAFAYGHAGWICLISSTSVPYYVKKDKLILPRYAIPAYIKIE